MVEIKEYEKLDSGLLEQWQKLWDKSPCAHFFNSPKWFSAFAKAYFPAGCSIVAAYENGSPAAFLPILKQKKFGITALTCPGGGHLAKLPLLAKENSREILGALAGYLAEKGSFYLPEVGQEAAGIMEKGGRKFVLREASVNPYFILNGDACYNFSERNKKQVRRKIKKFGSHLSLKSYKGPNLEGLEIAFALDARSAKRSKGLLTFTDWRDKQFYRNLAGEFGEQLVVDVLSFDSEPVIFSVNFIYGKVYHFYKTAYHADYGRIAPGKLLLYYKCPSLFEEGFKILDFSRGDSRYKKEFTPLFYRQYDLFYANNVLLKWWWMAAAAASGVKNRLYENETYQKIYSARKKISVKIKTALAHKMFWRRERRKEHYDGEKP
ncbi:MAG: GNAT family N-acetyltransferase [Patescibacteria group bacterium]|nr:GNAT family N-acetyltransferase [Patescibacteria group bacterium]